MKKKQTNVSYPVQLIADNVIPITLVRLVILDNICKMGDVFSAIPNALFVVKNLKIVLNVLLLMIKIDLKILQKTVNAWMDILRILLLVFVKNAKMKIVRHVIPMEIVCNVIQFTKFLPIVILIPKNQVKNQGVLLL